VNPSKINRKRAVWGILVIAAGVMLLLVQMDIVEWRDWREFWPAILMVIGVGHMAAANRPRHVVSGIAWVLWGLWFYACIQHWFGLTYRTGWPLLLVVVGLEMVLKAAFDRLGPAKEEARHA
jgi:hypothetical protein